MTPAPPVQRAADATPRSGSRRASIWERLTTLSEPGIEFLRVTYEVGGASSPPDAFQRHAGHEWGYVLRGRLEVRIGFDEYILEPGDAISINSSIPHRLATIGDEPVGGDLVRPRSGPVRRADAPRRAPVRPGLTELGRVRPIVLNVDGPEPWSSASPRPKTVGRSSCAQPPPGTSWSSPSINGSGSPRRSSPTAPSVAGAQVAVEEGERRLADAGPDQVAMAGVGELHVLHLDPGGTEGGHQPERLVDRHHVVGGAVDDEEG